MTSIDITMNDRSTVHALSGWRRWALLIFGSIVRLWTGSLRFKIEPEQELLLRNTDMPTVLLIWHNQLVAAVEIYRRFRNPKPLWALVSASRDGAWLSALLAVFGMRSVRGSSSRRALTATREMVALIRDGADIAITPDGPRGPCYDFKPGAVLVAQKAKAPVVLIACTFQRGWTLRLRSWDQFRIPLPFARVHIKVQRFPSFDAIGIPPDRDQAAAVLRELLLDLHGAESSRT